MDEALLFLLGGIGAAFYGVPVYVACRANPECPAALTTLVFAIAVGTVMGGILTPFVGSKFPWTVDPVPYPLALGIGLLANPLLPRIIDRGKAIFDSLSFKGPKT